MADTFDIEFPKDMPKDQAAALTSELKRIQGVRSAGISAHRSIDPASLMGWVTLAGAALPVLTSVVAMIRGSRMKGVKIKIGDKTIEVDEASATDIEGLSKSLS